jgi:transposase
MTRFVVGEDRSQSTLFPERLEDYLSEDNPVRAIDVFVDELDLAGLGFGGVEPEATGRPAYHPSTLLKIYVYGYLNRVQSSRRLERECQRNIESTEASPGWRSGARAARPRATSTSRR